MFDYAIKAHPTKYAGVQFRSRLEATWAAFFDLRGYHWEYEPIDLVGWSPDFLTTLPPECGCGCDSPIRLLIEVKPYTSTEMFNDHIAVQRYWHELGWGATALCTSVGIAGVNPTVFEWEMSDHSGGGYYQLTHGSWGSTEDIMDAWKEAQNLTRYQNKGRA